MVDLGPDLGLGCDDHHMVPLPSFFFPCLVSPNGVFGLYVMIDCSPAFLPPSSEQGRAKALSEGEPRMGTEPNSSVPTTSGESSLGFPARGTAPRRATAHAPLTHAPTQRHTHGCSCMYQKLPKCMDKGVHICPHHRTPLSVCTRAHTHTHTECPGEKCSVHFIMHPRFSKVIQDGGKGRF